MGPNERSDPEGHGSSFGVVPQYGAGYSTLDVAGSVSPDGQLDIFERQPEMLDHTISRAREDGVVNVVPTKADARQLAYPPATFAGASLRQAVRHRARIFRALRA